MAALLNQPLGGNGSALHALATARHAAHARLLEERPTSTAGEPFPLESALQALTGGQAVNWAAGPVVHNAEESAGASSFLARLGLLPRRRVERWSAEVLDVEVDAHRLLIGVPRCPDGLKVEQPAAVDFTDVTGTYHLMGTLDAVREGARGVCLIVTCRRATRVQLRRFVRVPVRITPRSLAVQEAPGAWRGFSGQVIDMSLGGLGLLVSEPLLADVHVRVELELPGRGGAITVRGRVVEPPGPAEAQVSGPKGQATYRRGLELEPLEIDDLRRLQRALYHRQVELRRLGDSLPERRALDGAPQTVASQRSAPAWKFWRRR